MFKKTRRELELIEPCDAERLRQHNIFDGQRNVRESHVNMLADEIRRGTFLTGDIGLARLDGRIYLVNGQHTILAVERSGIPIEAVVSWYQCETKDDVSDLFRRYDNNLVRSLRDVSIVEGKALGLEWKERIVQLVVTGAAMKLGMYQNRATKNQKAELLKRFVKHGQFLAEVLEPWSKSAHLRRGAVVHAIFETFEKDDSFAYVFWENVKTGEKLYCDDPEYLLREFLITKGTSRPSDKEVLYRCLLAWNNARKGIKIKILKYHSSAAIPKAI
ncbi:hypothetical protein [Desulfuromonas thiophila]|uniref:Uncharacterized protein n=1 Tax=Desulfuromonas thiophila TaxID=57664 RepID=A0A1G7B3F7_9BACT|nr:hypothetical protein [Desulfuromonas thiophila]SDE21561.1 hypothetical protein SAMN05661003_10546 [Desulfuromonas thiophila]